MTYNNEQAKNGTGSKSHDNHVVAKSAPGGGLEKEKRMYRVRALMTIGGLYGMVVSIMAIVVPFTYFLAMWEEQKFHYYYVFYGYVFLVSLAFIMYVSIMTHRLKDKTGEDQYGGPLPCVLVTGEGVNIYLTFAIIVFGSLGILFQILIFVAYTEDPLMMSCYGNGQIATSVLLVLFILSQMIFLLGHAKTVFNFKLIWLKFGFIHLIAANMCMWGLAIMFESTESYLHSQVSHGDDHAPSLNTHDDSNGYSKNTTTNERHRRAADSSHDSSDDSDSSVPFVFKCLQLETTAMKSSAYLIPFLVEFSLVAAGVLYGMFTNVGTRPHSQELKLLDKKNEEELNIRSCRLTSCLTYGHWFLVALSIAAVVINALVEAKNIDVGEHFSTVTMGIYFGIQYFLLVLSIILTIAAFFHTRKCHYLRYNPESFFDEMLLYLSIGGFFFLLAFVIIAMSYLVNKSGTSPQAELYIVWVILNYIQSVMQVVFIRDGFRRKALTRSCVTNYTSKNLIVLNSTCNQGLWIVMSFMVNKISSSVLMTSFYDSLTWIIISSIFLPLSIFFRFHVGACLSEVVEGLYHGSCYIGGRRLNPKHWEHKE